jgi:hypothetical protein
MNDELFSPPGLEEAFDQIRRVLRGPDRLPQLVYSASVPTYASYARSIVKGRAKIGDHFNEHMFADPAFDMLLELFADHEEGRKTSIKSCSLAARTPPTTALRWIAMLEQEGLITRHIDTEDARRTLLRLTSSAHERLLAYLGEISSIPLRR